MALKRRNGWRAALLGLLLVSVGAIAFLRSRVAWEGACTLARRELPVLLGLDVGIGRCEIDPVNMAVRLHGLSAFEPGTDTPLLIADSAEVSLGSFQPFFGRVGIDWVRISRPRVTLELAALASRRQKPKEPGKCGPLSGMRRVVIDRLDLTDAEVRLALPAGRRVEVSGVDLRWKTRRGVTEFQLDAKKGWVQARADAVPLTLARLSMEGGLDVSEERLELNRGELGLEDITVSLGGRVDQLCDPVLALEGQLFAPLKSVGVALRSHQELGGHLWARVSASGKPGDAILSAELKGTGITVGKLSPGDFSARLSLMGDEVSIQELKAPAGPGFLSAAGTLKLTPALPVQVRFETDNAEFAEVMDKAGVRGAWVDFFASGKGTASGTLLPAPNLNGEADLRVARFLLASRAYNAPLKTGSDILAFDQAKVQVGLRVLADRVDLHGAKVDLPPLASGGATHVTADVTLFYDQSKGLNIVARPEQLNFAHFKQIAGIPWSGEGSGLVTITGPYGDVHIEGALSVRDFAFWKFSLGTMQSRVTFEKKVLSFAQLSGQKGSTPYAGAGALTFGPHLLTQGRVDLLGGRLEDVVDMIAPRHPSIAIFQGTTGGAVSGHVDIHGPAKQFAGAVNLEVKGLTYDGRRMGAGKLGLRFEDGQRMVLDPVTLSGPLGLSQLEGTFDFDGPLAFTFRGTDLSFAELAGREDAERLGLDGKLTLVGKVSGDSATPVVKMYLTSPRVQFANRSLGRTHLEAEIEGKDMQIYGTLFDDARTVLKLKLREPFAYQASVNFALPEIRPLLPTHAISQGLSGSISGAIQATGNLRDLGSVNAKATVDKLVFSRGDFSAASEFPFELTYVNGKAQLDALSLKGPNTQLSAGGSVAPNALDVTLEGLLDMRLVESFVPGIERAAGKVEIRASASGSPKKPRLLGTAEIRDARFSMRDQPVAARSVSGRLEFSDSRVLIPALEGVVNDGRVSVKGDVRLANLQIATANVDGEPPLRLNLLMDEVSLPFIEQAPMNVSGQLTLYGKPDDLILTGDIDLLKLRYEKPLELESMMLEVGRARYLGRGEKAQEWLRLDVDIHSRGDVRIDNNLARAKMEGSVKLTGTNLRPGLLGTITAAEGSQAYFRGNQFAVSQGLLEFKDRKSIEAVFDLHAQTQVREYLVRLHAFGRLTEPKLILTSEPELQEGDILSLLTLGVVSHDRSNTANAGAGLAAEALMKVSGLDRQVQRFLPKNQILRDMSFHISSAYNSAAGAVEPTAQLESKLLTEKLRLNVSYPLSGKGRRAQVEYRFNNRVSGQFQWDNENRQSTGENFGLDLKFHWELE
ncbi:MAG: translocation/assembly module TamB domain-containing protein [Myxococcaceae bacterium]